jgi:hypothetical protein
MSVFLRWGIFGILGVAALVYAYNASKRMAEAHAAKQAAAANAPAPATEPPPAVEPVKPEPIPPAPPAEPVVAIPARCAAELAVAQRAIEMRKQGAPLDRVMRMQEIAFEESPERRQRLETVATRWFGYEGDFSAGALRIAVVNDCQQASPAP